MSGDGCTPFHELLSAQLDGALDSAESERLLTHLAACSACQRQRDRLRRTVDTLRREGHPLLELPPDAWEQLTARLRAADSAPAADPGEDACAPFRELISGQLDDALEPEETDRLLDHLASCSVCSRHRHRLQRSVARVREAGPLLPLEESAFAELNARLDAAARAERAAFQPVRAERTPAQPDPIPPDEASPDAASPAEGPAGLLLRFPARQAARWAAAAAILVGAGLLLRERAPGLVAALERLYPDPVEVEYEDPRPPELAPTPTPYPTPFVPASPTPAPTPTHVVQATPAPSGTPAPAVTPAATPGAEPTPTPTTRERSRPTPTPAVAVALAELQTLLRRIRSSGLEPERRPRLVASLGAPRFDHRLTYELLDQTLRGAFDGYRQREATRRAAFRALGQLGSPAAVAVLLAAPLRPQHDDASELQGALCALTQDAAVELLAGALDASGRHYLRDEERRLVALQALDRLARPAATAGLLAMFQRGRERPYLRRDAAIALGKTGDPRAFGPLRAGLDAKKPLIRVGSALGLGRLARAHPEDAPACVASLQPLLRPRESLLVKEAALRALGSTLHRAAVEPLIAHLDVVEPRTRLEDLTRQSLWFLAGGKPSKRRSPDEWRAFWGAWPADRPLQPAPPERLVPDDFRKLPGHARGVVFVLDASASMAKWWELARYELRKAVDYCPADVGIQLLLLGATRPRAALPAPRRRLLPARVDVKRELLERVSQERIDPSAKTRLLTALEEALQFPEADTIYLISDGLAEQDGYARVLQRVARTNRRRERPVRIHCVQLRHAGDPVRVDASVRPGGARGEPDEPADMALMRGLARASGGVYAHN